MSASATNWAGNVVFAAQRRHRPESIEDLQSIVAGAAKARALGTGHSFNSVADTIGDQISVAGLAPGIEIDAALAQVSVAGGVRFGELAPVLNAAGFALHNLGSLPHITIAGACATGTHGSGVGNPNLASAVVALDFVGPDGSLHSMRRGDQDFEGSVVALGCLGIVTRMMLELVPAFEIRQWVYEDLGWLELCESLPEILAAAYSVSVFTNFKSTASAGPASQIWVKRRVDSGAETPSRWLGARLADGPRHPVPGVDPVHCTQQLGVAGPWHERLPHFRLDFTPSSGEELQTEYLLPAANAVPALRELAEIADQIAAVLQISEIRAIAADELWLSPSYQQDSIALHFTWIADSGAVAPVLAALEQRLAPFAARPHWGKVFSVATDRVRELYPRYADFESLIHRHDPNGKFRNDTIDFYFR